MGSRVSFIIYASHTSESFTSRAYIIIFEVQSLQIHACGNMVFSYRYRGINKTNTTREMTVADGRRTGRKRKALSDLQLPIDS